MAAELSPLVLDASGEEGCTKHRISSDKPLPVLLQVHFNKASRADSRSLMTSMPCAHAIFFTLPDLCFAHGISAAGKQSKPIPLQHSHAQKRNMLTAPFQMRAVPALDWVQGHAEKVLTSPAEACPWLALRMRP